MAYWKKALAVMFVSIVALRIVKFMRFLGVHKNMYDHYPGPCHAIEAFTEGAEDIQVLGNGQGFVTTGLRLDGAKKEMVSKRKGQIMLLNFNNLAQKPVPLKIIGDVDKETFQPHGLYVYNNVKTGNVHIYVVNHKPNEETVEKFLFDSADKSLTHMKSFTHESFRWLNDLVVVADDQFYFTNFFFFHQFLELVVGLRWGNIGFFDGSTPENTRTVAEGFLLPNGITKSPNGRIIYMGTWGDQTVYVFKRQKNDDLKLIQTQPVYTSVDNLDIDHKNSELWLAGDYIPYMFISHLGDPENVAAPAHVLNLKLDEDGKIVQVVEVFAEHDSAASGSSVAVYYGGSMVIGSKMAGAVTCDMRHLFRKKTIVNI